MHCNYMSVSRSFLCNFHRRHLNIMLDHHSMVSKKNHYAQITLGAWTLWKSNFTLRFFGSPTWSRGANTARLFVSVGRCGEQVHRCNLRWWCSCGHMVVLHHRWRHQLRATGKWSPWSNLCKDCWSNWQIFLRLNQFCVQSIFLDHMVQVSCSDNWRFFCVFQLPKVMELIGLGYTGWFVYRYLLFKVRIWTMLCKQVGNTNFCLLVHWRHQC